MKVQKINNSQSFGWRLDTHFNITSQALKHFPNLKKHEDMIMFGVDAMAESTPCKNIMKSFTGSYSAHDVASFYIPRTSFDLYYENLISSINHFEDKNTEGIMKMVGENIQYLQDVASPLNTHREPISIFGFFKRGKFERFADKNPQIVDEISSYEPRQTFYNFFDIFYRTYKKSKNMQSPYEFMETKDMQKAVRTAIGHAYDATSRFLRRFELFSALPDEKKDDFLLQEIEQSKILKLLKNSQKG